MANIVISNEAKENLDKLKTHPRDTYCDVVNSLITAKLNSETQKADTIGKPIKVMKADIIEPVEKNNSDKNSEEDKKLFEPISTTTTDMGN